MSSFSSKSLQYFKGEEPIVDNTFCISRPTVPIQFRVNLGINTANYLKFTRRARFPLIPGPLSYSIEYTFYHFEPLIKLSTTKKKKR